jgi:HK97 family phage prohead protease
MPARRARRERDPEPGPAPEACVTCSEKATGVGALERKLADVGLELRGGDGEFVARMAVFDVVDRAQDRLRPGAFADSLLAWKRKNRMPPLMWGHRHDDPAYRIGKVLELTEDDRGLVVHAQLDLSKAKAADTYDLLRHNEAEFSFAFETKAATMVREDGRLIRDITAVHLLEVGPCLIGMNPETELLALKHWIDGKAGRTLSADTRGRLRAIAQELLDFVATHDTDIDPAPAEPLLADAPKASTPRAALARQRLALWSATLSAAKE